MVPRSVLALGFATVKGRSGAKNVAQWPCAFIAHRVPKLNPSYRRGKRRGYVSVRFEGWAEAQLVQCLPTRCVKPNAPYPDALKTEFDPPHRTNWLWWCTPLILALGR